MATKNNKARVITLRANKANLYNAVSDRDQNILGKKIAEARNGLGLSLAAFKSLLAEYGVDVSVAAINKWEMGGSAPNAYQLLAIGQALQVDVDYTYFMSVSSRSPLNREGIAKLAEYRDDLVASGRYKPQPVVSKIIKFIEMPVSNLAVSAGTGEFLDEGNFEMVSFPESSVPEGAEFGLRVSGDSMEPVYHDGQIVWVQQCDHVGVGEVGIFIYDGDGYIKVYDEQIPDEADREEFTDSYGDVHMQPIMISYNQKYQPRYVSAHSNFQVVGRVL